jgi:hypothetical protein
MKKEVKAWLEAIPEDRRAAMEALRKTIIENLPEGFEETIFGKMLYYVVPYSLYPAGYHCPPDQPLPFLAVANQKNFIALYHMGIYAKPEVLKWFEEEYPKHSKGKLDMGKSCIRFKKPEQIPMELMAALMKKFSPKEWIQVYEEAFKKGR